LGFLAREKVGWLVKPFVEEKDRRSERSGEGVRKVILKKPKRNKHFHALRFSKHYSKRSLYRHD
jgi:hypothetical protein